MHLRVTADWPQMLFLHTNVYAGSASSATTCGNLCADKLREALLVTLIRVKRFGTWLRGIIIQINVTVIQSLRHHTADHSNSMVSTIIYSQ